MVNAEGEGNERGKGDGGGEKNESKLPTSKRQTNFCNQKSKENNYSFKLNSGDTNPLPPKNFYHRLKFCNINNIPIKHPIISSCNR